MRELSRPTTLTGALARLNYQLHRLYARAGKPSVRKMAEKAGHPVKAVWETFSKPQLPNAIVLLDVVAVLGREQRLLTVDVDALVQDFDDMFDEAWAEHVPPPPGMEPRGLWPDDPGLTTPRTPRGPAPLGAGGAAASRRQITATPRAATPPATTALARTAPPGQPGRNPRSHSGARILCTLEPRFWTLADLRERLARSLDEAHDGFLLLLLDGGTVVGESGLAFQTADSERDEYGRWWNLFPYRELQAAVAYSEVKEIVAIIADSATDRPWQIGVREELLSPVDRSVFLVFTSSQAEGLLYKRLLDSARTGGQQTVAEFADDWNPVRSVGSLNRGSELPIELVRDALHASLCRAKPGAVATNPADWSRLAATPLGEYEHELWASSTEGPETVACAILPDGAMLTIARDSRIRQWSRSADGNAFEVAIDDGYVGIPVDQACTVASVNGQTWVVSATGSQSLWAWNVTTKQRLHRRIRSLSLGWIRSVAITPDGQIATLDESGNVSIHEEFEGAWRDRPSTPPGLS